MKKLLLLLTLLITLISCNDGKGYKQTVVKETAKASRYSVTIDTLTIHGHKHEFIRDCASNHSGISLL